MSGSSSLRAPPQLSFPSNSTQPIQFTSDDQAAPESAGPFQLAFHVPQPAHSDLVSAQMVRNLSTISPRPHRDQNEQPVDVGDNLGLCYELGVFEQLDSIKFLLLHFRVEQTDPALFEKLKRRTLTVPHAVERIIREDACFANQLARFYSALTSQSESDLQSSVIKFRQDIANLTRSGSLTEMIMIYCVYRTTHDRKYGFLRKYAFLSHRFVSQILEVIEIIFRTSHCDLLSLLQLCRDSLAQNQNCHFLSGIDLADSPEPGQMFLLDGRIKSKFMYIMGPCDYIQLTSSSAFLCDISPLSGRLMGTSNAGLKLQQVVKNSTDYLFERMKIWIAHRKPLCDEMTYACNVLGEFIVALEKWYPPVEVYQVGFKRIAGLPSRISDPQPDESEFLNLKLVTVLSRDRQGLYLEKVEDQYIQAENFGDLNCPGDLENLIAGACNKWLPNQWFGDFADDSLITGDSEADCNLKMKRASYVRRQKENILRRRSKKKLKGMTGFKGFKEVDEDSDVDSDDGYDEMPGLVSVSTPADTAAMVSAMAEAWSEEFPFADADDF